MCCAKRGAFDELGAALMSLGVCLEQELGAEFGGDLEAAGDFGGVAFLVCLREKRVR